MRVADAPSPTASSWTGTNATSAATRAASRSRKNSAVPMSSRCTLVATHPDARARAERPQRRRERVGQPLALAGVGVGVAGRARPQALLAEGLDQEERRLGVQLDDPEGVTLAQEIEARDERLAGQRVVQPHDLVRRGGDTERG